MYLFSITGSSLLVVVKNFGVGKGEGRGGGRSALMQVVIHSGVEVRNIAPSLAAQEG